ncbi:MAG: putative diguanylate cyclase YegE [Frankiales bacterium]|nr:putative diguanylate cyclase YegE [Frankiales bacterium]
MGDDMSSRAGRARRQHLIDALLETIEVGIVACDADGVFVVSNRAERELFGFDDHLSGPLHDLDSRIDVFRPDGAKLGPAEYPLMRALRGEDVSQVDVLAGPAGGPYREIVVRGRQIAGPQGEVLGAVAALTDVTAERTTARALTDEHRRLVEAQRIGQLGSFEHDFGTGGWTWSENLTALWGLARDADAPAAVPQLHPADRTAALRAWRDAGSPGGPATWTFRIRRADNGEERVIRCRVEVEFGSDGQPLRCRGTHQDVTELHRAEQDAQRAQAFFQAVLAASPDGFVVTDVSTGQVVYGSPKKDVLGLGAEQLLALGQAGIDARTHPDDLPRLTALNGAAAGLQDGDVLSADYRSMHADGRWRWLSRRVTPFRRSADGAVVEVLAVVRDVTAVLEAEDRLRHDAKHDHLTGLPNRALLAERLEEALTQAHREGDWEVAVLFCDLDGFKRVNDTGGHAAGDAVLVETARRLLSVVREGDIVARVGGDEFVVVLRPWRPDRQEPAAGEARSGAAPDRSLAIQVAERLAAAVRRPITVGGVPYVVTASIGVTHARRAAADGPIESEAVFQAADAAMYQAKAAGKDRFSVL